MAAFMSPAGGVYTAHGAMPQMFMSTAINAVPYAAANALPSTHSRMFAPMMTSTVAVPALGIPGAITAMPSPYTMELVQETAMLEHGSNRMVGKQMAFYQGGTQTNSEPRQPRVRRTFKELQRELECPHEGCPRRYASRSSLATHVRLKHSLEAKQQQEDMKMQRKKSFERQATPRPVRPRAHPTMLTSSLELLRHHSVTGGFVVPATMAEPASLGNLCSSSFTSPAFGYATPPAFHMVDSCASTPKSEPICRSRSFSLPSTALTRPSSVSLSSVSSPTPSMASLIDYGASTDSLAQPIHAVAMDDVLLSHLDLDFNSFELGSAASTPAASKRSSICYIGTPVEEREASEDEVGTDAKELEEMQLLLCGFTGENSATP